MRQDHLRRECPNVEGGGKAQPQAAMHTSSPTLSIGDMCNTPHMMPARSFFATAEDVGATVVVRPNTSMDNDAGGVMPPVSGPHNLGMSIQLQGQDD